MPYVTLFRAKKSQRLDPTLVTSKPNSNIEECGHTGTWEEKGAKQIEKREEKGEEKSRERILTMSQYFSNFNYPTSALYFAQNQHAALYGQQLLLCEDIKFKD